MAVGERKRTGREGKGKGERRMKRKEVEIRRAGGATFAESI